MISWRRGKLVGDYVGGTIYFIRGILYLGPVLFCLCYYLSLAGGLFRYSFVSMHGLLATDYVFL